MTEPAPTATPSLRRNSVGFVGIAFFVVASAAPMAAFVGAGPVLFAMMGPGVPLVYLLVAGVVAIFAVGYLRMSRHIRNAGGLVAYVARGLGDRWATGAAGIVVITYLALQIGLWAQYGLFMQQLLARVGLHLPVTVCVLLTLFLTTVLTMRGIDLNLRVLGVLIVLEIAVVAVLVVGILVSTGGTELSPQSFDPAQLASPGLGLAVLFVYACFTTFEATTVFAEEARDPRRTIPRALYAVIVFVGIFYTVSTWSVSVGVGPDNVQEAAAADLGGIVFALATQTVGPWLSMAMEVLVVTSFIAMLLGMQNMFARYTFALSRARVLPSALARLSRRQTPARAAVAIGAVVAIVLVAFLAAGADPIAVVYAWFVALGTVGFLTMMTIASVAIIAFFLRERLETGAWATRIAPALALLLNTAVLIVAVTNYDAMLVDGGGVARWLLVLLPAAFIAGWLLASNRRDIDYTIVAAA